MRKLPRHDFRILGIAPSTRGFGFAVLESRGRLVSWGVARLYSKTRDEFLQRLTAMIEKYDISVLCLEDVAGQRRGSRSMLMIRSAACEARRMQLLLSFVTRQRVQAALGLEGRATKHLVATSLAEVFPELASVLPPARKPWKSEDERMKLFDAASLVSAVVFDITDALGSNAEVAGI